MTPRTMAGLLRSRAAALSNQLAVRFREGGNWVAWTWRDCWDMARAAATGLHAAGVRPGDPVLVVVPEVRPAVTTLFGLWALGAVPIQVGLPFALSDPALFLNRLTGSARQLGAEVLVRLVQADGIGGRLVFRIEEEETPAGNGPAAGRYRWPRSKSGLRRRR